jgi:hypothetical protein
VEEPDELTELVDLAAYLSISAHDEGTRQAAEAKRLEAFAAINAALARITGFISKLTIAQEYQKTTRRGGSNQ